MFKSGKNRNERIQKALGSILLEARQAKGFTRKELAQRTGIGESSIVRYEKLGIDEIDGQHPPADKLALLCFYLGIPAQEAHWSCLPQEEFRREQEDQYDDVAFHPAYEYLTSEYFHLLKENGRYREALRILLSPGNQYENYSEEDLDELQEYVANEALKLIEAYDNFELRMLAAGNLSLGEVGMFTSSPHDKELVFSVRNGRPPSFYPNQFWIERADERISELTQQLEKIKSKRLIAKEKNPD
jgi:transcriptional regulator with XRE-family HTH domain